MKHETTSSAAGEEGGGTAAMQPLPVSDELISRLAGRCEEIFPLNDRLRHDEISDEEIHEMESLLKRLRPAPVRVLFREQCCSLMCAESEHEMETRLKRLSASSMLEFSVCKMAQAMDCAGEAKQEKAVKIPLWRRLAYISGISVAAAVGAVLLVQNTLVAPGGTVAGGNEVEAGAEKTEAPVLPGEKRELLRKPTLFELQGLLPSSVEFFLKRNIKGPPRERLWAARLKFSILLLQAFALSGPVPCSASLLCEEKESALDAWRSSFPMPGNKCSTGREISLPVEGKASG